MSKSYIKDFEVNSLEIQIDRTEISQPISERISFSFKDSNGKDVFTSLTREQLFFFLIEKIVKD